MTILAFSVARFTPADIATFLEIAAPRLQTGRWAAFHRQSGPRDDRIVIELPGKAEPTFSFKRDYQGCYGLYYHDHDGAHCIGFGASAAECLRVWRTSSRPHWNRARNRSMRR